LQQDCPRCKTAKLQDPIEKNAISSRDGKTWICSDCGNDESQIDFLIFKNKKSRITFQSITKEKYFCKKLGVQCNAE